MTSSVNNYLCIRVNVFLFIVVTFYCALTTNILVFLTLQYSYIVNSGWIRYLSEMSFLRL
jgi:hypothetical protein